ncbi:MAG: glucuronyl hydrolase [Prolixibacteraceae bacterium]
MKNLIVPLFLMVLLLACQPSKQEITLGKVNSTLELSKQKSVLMAESLADQPDKLPRTINEKGELVTCNSAWWVSGFFPGQLWYMYEYSGDSILKNWAENYTWRVADQQYTTDNHDVGFMIFCSFGNAYRITKDPVYLSVIKTAAASLSTRFDSTTQCIRSWDSAGWNQKWQFAVIIDNMMNLELLEWSAKSFEQAQLDAIARTHANTTIKNHFRSDGSSYHVISYDTITGLPHAKNTAQGYSDSSAWARGQAWGLYGYTMMFRETGDSTYLTQAISIADFIVNHPRLPEDKIPYWDFDAPDIPNAKRDASAGAITCSALLELQKYVDSPRQKQYFDVGEQQLNTLCSDVYLSKLGENQNFILKHSVGHIPANSEVDVPLSYADYYFVEAMLRYRELVKK